MEKVIEKIMSARSAAILPHVNEDADALGSCFALAGVMRSMGKKAVVYVNGTVEGRLSFMGSEYEEYVPGKKYEHDLCVCLDCGDLGRIGGRRELFDAIGNSVNIDHHYTNTNFADENYVDGSASSTGEILYRLLKNAGIEITKETARRLYTAICSDTGCFKYSSVSPETMRAAAELIETGIDHAEIARLLFDCETLEAAKLKAEATEKMESFYGGKLRIVTMPEGMCGRYGIAVEDAPNLVDIPRTIVGTEIAVCIKELEDEVRVNLRSNGEADVSIIAAKLGGGGHKKAAGCTVKNASADGVKEEIIKECGYLI